MSWDHLPGESTFSTIIDSNALYVDKTEYIYNLLSPPKGDYFLSRPRRFGKTLLLSTIKELFSGDRKRFKDLWIGRHSDYAFPKHPVISLSLSMRRSGPETIERSITKKLRLTAKEHGLAIRESSPGRYLGELVRALHGRYESKVAVLIDDCDVPVTRSMDDPEVARANAYVLHDFLARLKEGDMLERLRFTMVAGITRYGLNPGGDGTNFLNDVSFAPEYAGICGFTPGEFDSAFAGLMRPALESLKRNGEMARSAGVGELRAKILEWYGGYNWGGEGGVLNPFSVIRFFQTAEFAPHWVRSGRSRHLSDLIRANPEAFVHIDDHLEFSSDELRKTELSELKLGPVLFHSGYLALDEVLYSTKTSPAVVKDRVNTNYLLRIPNYEVKGVYYNDYFRLAFKKPNNEILSPIGDELRQSLLDKDAQAVSNIFNNHISTLPFYHMPRDESGFHRLVHSLLKGMGFTVAGEMPGASGRLDICVELPGRVYILMGLKYRPTRNRPKPTLTPEEEDAVLTSLLVETLPADDVYGILAEVAMVKLDVAIRLRISKPNLPTEERNRRLAEALFYSFAAAEINKILASAARRIVPEAEIVAALDKRAPGAYLPARRSGAISEAALTKASNQAVYDIAAREYRGVLALRAKRIVDLGLAIHGDKVKAVFGRDTDPSMPDEPPRRRERPGAKTLRS